MTETVLELQDALRLELKTPAGPVYTDVDTLLSATGRPLVTVGDVVTYHVISAGETPDVALIDSRTERSTVAPEIADTLDAFEGFERERTATNPAATLTVELLAELRQALDVAHETTTRIVVDGEEDLAALPAIACGPDGASVVYGQPGEGMVHVTVNSESKATMRDLLGRMTGDTDRLASLLGCELSV